MRESRLRAFIRLSAVGISIVAIPAAALDGTVSARLQAGTSTGAAAPAASGGPSAPASSRLFSRYRAFVGTDADTRSLIQGLRHGEMITLGGDASGSGSIEFLAPTRPMGWGSIDRALSLAQRQLASMGMTQPTAVELQAALTGGSVVSADGSTVDLQGVLTLRSQGMGWGKIAHTLEVSAAAALGKGVQSAGTGAGSASAATAKAELMPSERVRATFAPRGPNQSTANGVIAGQGAVVTAGGVVPGNGARAPHGGSDSGDSGRGLRFKFDGDAKHAAGVSAPSVASALPASVAGGAMGHGGGSISAAAGSRPGLGLGRR